MFQWLIIESRVRLPPRGCTEEVNVLFSFYVKRKKEKKRKGLVLFKFNKFGTFAYFQEKNNNKKIMPTGYRLLPRVEK